MLLEEEPYQQYDHDDEHHQVAQTDGNGKLQRRKNANAIFFLKKGRKILPGRVFFPLRPEEFSVQRPETYVQRPETYVQGPETYVQSL